MAPVEATTPNAYIDNMTPVASTRVISLRAPLLFRLDRIPVLPITLGLLPGALDWEKPI